jgi:hypothetical protein
LKLRAVTAKLGLGHFNQFSSFGFIYFGYIWVWRKTGEGKRRTTPASMDWKAEIPKIPINQQQKIFPGA